MRLYKDDKNMFRSDKNGLVSGYRFYNFTTVHKGHQKDGLDVGKWLEFEKYRYYL